MNAKPLLTFPDIFPNGLANKWSFSLVGEAYYRLGGTRRNKIKTLPQFYHMLDLFGEWNRAMGPAGFLQYQFIVPPGAVEGFKEIIGDIQRSGQYSFLNVFKLFGPGNQAPLSFPMEGWNVCVDFPINDRLGAFVDHLDAKVMSMGGRRTRPRTRSRRALPRHVPGDRRLDLHAAADRISGVFVSDMGRRPSSLTPAERGRVRARAGAPHRHHPRRVTLCSIRPGNSPKQLPGD